ncbi:MAG: hypothetical protein RR533_04540 [Carnobacterium sp.]
MDKIDALVWTVIISVILFFMSAIVVGIYEAQGFAGTILSTLGVFAFGFVWMYIYKKWGDKNQ